jgi:glucan phosphoethanolaminetransferase (alkaline phosphatase superfamily)
MRRTEKFCTLGVALMYVAPVVAMVAWAASSQAPRGILAVALTALLLACLFAAATRTWRLFFLVQFPLSALAVAFVLYTLVFHMPPGRTLALLLLGTSWEEVRGFISLPQGKMLAGALVAWSAVYLLLAAGTPRAPIFAGRAVATVRALVALAVPVTAYVAYNPMQLIDGIALNPAIGSLMFLGGTLPEASRELHGSRVSKVPYDAHRTGGEEVHVLIIGESARRASWSAYGYSRPTTPELDALGSEVLFLRDASADANLTEWAVPILLTGIPPESYMHSRISGNLVDLAKEAGYSTAWLVNQDITISMSVGVNPDRLEYPPDFNSDINGRHALDEALLPAYRREIARGGAPRFIGIHMMGSHWEYYRRYPARFGRFGTHEETGALTTISVFVSGRSNESAVVDAYDNSVLYTDWFLRQVIEQTRQLTVPASITFIADHGEDLQLLDGEAGHGEPYYTRHAFEIPAFVWVNDAFRRAHPQIVDALHANANKRIRSHDVLQTVAEMMGVQWPGRDARRSFASDRFLPDTRGKYVAGGVLVAPN